MKIIPSLSSLWLILTVIALSACGNDAEEDSLGQLNQDSTAAKRVSKVSNIKGGSGFQITVPGLINFSHMSKRAKAINYQNTYWEFKGDGALVRLTGRFDYVLIDAEQVSNDLKFNNVYLEFYQSIDGKNTRISCKAAKEPKGFIQRIITDDLSSSGSFEIAFITCRNTYTSKPIESIQVPFKVTGHFNDIPHSESLF